MSTAVTQPSSNDILNTYQKCLSNLLPSDAKIKEMSKDELGKLVSTIKREACQQTAEKFSLTVTGISPLLSTEKANQVVNSKI